MFSKNKFLFPQISLPFIGTTNGTEILLQQHHDLLSTHYLAANASVLEASTFTNQENVGGINNGDPFAMGNPSSRKLQTVKKDRRRHSKIFTAQGPRDRRVRLSISTAGKFFDLQEMLGFDKPSKTLDWLLTKSKGAIKEINLIKQKSSTADLEICSEAFENVKIDSKKKPLMTGCSLSKESRVKARARARERTREKMCIKKIYEAIKRDSDLSPSIPIQSRNWDQFEVCKKSSSLNDLNKMDSSGIREPSIPNYPLTHGQELMKESTVIRRKLEHPSINLGFHQNLIISKDPSSNCSNIPLTPNADENWDLVGFTPQSNQCAILNQQRFINRCSNI